MYKHLKSLIAIFAVIASVAFFAACTGNDKKETGQETAILPTPPAAAFLTSGYLDTLYIGKGAFDTINAGSRLQFSFVFIEPDTLTLHGWLFRPGGGPSHKQFDSLPNIKLVKGKPSGITYGPGTYFSGISLSPGEYTKLKNALTSTTRYVVFVPYVYGKAVGYKIFITNDDISAVSGQILYTLDPTGADANPSPPKNY